MRDRELLEVGDRLNWVWGPYSDACGSQSGGRVGYDQVETIVVDRLAGPMGWYVVAVIKRSNGAPDVILPLHMAETFAVMPPEQPENQTERP